MYLIVFVVLKDMSLTRMFISISNALLLVFLYWNAGRRRYSSNIFGEYVVFALLGPNQ